MKGLSFFGFVAPMIILLVVIVWIGITIVGKNINAKDLVFSYTALAAAFVMFSLNLWFSLTNEESVHLVQPHLILSSECVDVYSELPMKSDFVVFNREKLTSALNLSKTVKGIGVPKLTDDESAALKRNLAEFLRISVVGHLLSEYPDWNPKIRAFRGSQHIQFNNSREGAGKNSYYSVEQLKTSLKLKISDFDLSEAVGMINKGLTLPPKTVVTTTGEDVIIENPHLRIEIEFEVADGMTFASPSYAGSTLRLDMGNSDYAVINVQSNIKVTVSRKRQRSGSPERPKYDAWASDLIESIRSGFSPVFMQTT